MGEQRAHALDRFVYRLMRREPPKAEVEQRHFYPTSSWNAYQALFNINGHMFAAGVGGEFRARAARHLLETCGPAYAVLDRRVSVLGEARPAFQRFERGVPAGLFSTPELEILRQPWLGGSWRQLVATADMDVAAAGNSYWIREGAELVRLEPDWVTIVAEEVKRDGKDIGFRLIGYAVSRTGSKGDAVIFEPGQVAHYRPSPSMAHPWRGESWLAAVAIDASADVEMTSYKGNYLKNGAMPSLAVMYEPTIPIEQVQEFVPLFAEKFTGSLNAGKVLHFLGGRDVKTVGATLDQLAFKAVQGAGETRIASAAGVPAVVAGFSEGMQGSSLNAGNYVATRRLFGDAKVRPLLGSLCEAFEVLVRTPAGARLWYDDSQVSFFQEDVLDEATIRQNNALTIRQLVDGGFTPETAVDAVIKNDFSLLKHTGLFSVQLQPPTDGTSPTPQPTQEGEDVPS